MFSNMFLSKSNFLSKLLVVRGFAKVGSCKNDDFSLEDIICGMVEPCHIPRVIQHLREYFYVEEPLHKMLNVTSKGEPHKEIDELIAKELEEGLSVMALDTKVDKVVGVSVNTDDGDGSFKAERKSNPKMKKIQEFCKALHGNCDLKDCFNASSWLFIQKLSVDPVYRGRGVVWKLIEETKEVAEMRLFTGLKSEATATQTQIILQRSGFDTVTELLYKDFPCKDDPWFKPEPPHLSAKLMAAHISQIVLNRKK